MSSRVLCIAFHYPPFAGSSGVQRTLRFSQYLPDYGWEPIIHTARATAYESTSEELLDDVPSDTVVYRSFCLDAMRHLSIRGRYPDSFALPDRWSSWILSGVITGLWAIIRHRPKVIWSTYPISSAHVIALTLARMTGLPWVADFRDPMVEYIEQEKRWAPSDERLRAIRLWIEKQASKHASRLVFCTLSAMEICRQRHSNAEDGRYRVIPNGYDEVAFQKCEQLTAHSQREKKGPLRIIHSGVIYGGADRDPVPLFRAISRLMQSGYMSPRELEVIFRGSNAESRYRNLVDELNLNGTIIFKPPCNYLDSITEMLNADGLLVLQGYASNPAIPAKVYEYLRTGNPILALVDAKGETASFLGGFEGCLVVQPDSVEDIAEALEKHIDILRQRRGCIVRRAGMGKYSRQALAGQLAGVLDESAASRRDST